MVRHYYRIIAALTRDLIAA